MAPGQESNKFWYNHYLIFLCDHQLMYIKWKVCKEACHTVNYHASLFVQVQCRCKCMEGKINLTGIYVHCHTSILQVYMLSIHLYFYIIPAYNQPRKLSINTNWMIMFRNIAWSQFSSRWYRTPPYCGVLQIEIIQ